MTDTMQNKEKKPSRRKYIIAAGMFVFLTMSALVFIIFSQNQKPDPASEALIRQLVSVNLHIKTIMETDPNSYTFPLVLKPELAIDPNELTDEDFLKIESLSLGYPYPSSDQSNSSRELCDIKLIKKFTNLKSFIIGSIRYPPNKIPKWMSLLAKLGIFNLEDRFALDLSPLKKLNNLETLIIEDTNVKNLKVLKNLTNIQELSLCDTQFSNLEYIRKYANLKSLDIYNTQVSDLEPLRELKSLKKLCADKTPVSNLEPLKELKNLIFLDISNCKNITDEQVEDLRKALPELRIVR